MKKRLALLGLTAAVLSTAVIPVAADELNDAQNQKEYINDKINDISKQKQDEKNKLNSVQQQKNNLANAQSKAEKDLQQATIDYKKAQEETKAIDAAVKEVEEKYEKQKELFKTRLRIMYQNSNNSYIHTLAQSGSVSDFLSKLQIISTVAKRDKELVLSLEDTKKDVEYKKKLQEDAEKQKAQTVEEKKRTVSTIQASRSQKEAEERAINSTLANLTKQENDLLKKSEELTNIINTLTIRRKGGYVNGKMGWPTPGYSGISSPFGNRLHPVLGVYRMHTGIDINAPAGAAIVAANKGTVILAGWQDGYGNTVIVDHGGDIVTLYGHCSKLLVSVGQEVNAGDVIAKVGSTGLATGPHLHFEVRAGGALKDPLGYVSP